MSHDTFISHSSHDSQVAHVVCGHLEKNGIDCWMAPRDISPGEDWAESIVGAITESKLVVFIFSSNSNTSSEISREINLASKMGLPILPVRLENIQPSKKLIYYLSTPHWLDALPPPVENHLERLVKSVRTLLLTSSAMKASRGPDRAESPIGNLGGYSLDLPDGEEKSPRVRDSVKSPLSNDQTDQKPDLAGKAHDFTVTFDELDSVSDVQPIQISQEKVGHFLVKKEIPDEITTPETLNIIAKAESRPARLKWIFRNKAAIFLILGMLFIGFLFLTSDYWRSKDKEVAVFTLEFDAATNEVIKQIEANPSAAGIDEAQKIFTRRKPSLRARYDVIKNARGMQVSDDILKIFTDNLTKNTKALTDVMNKNMTKFMEDKEALNKFQALIKDYTDTFKMEDN